MRIRAATRLAVALSTALLLTSCGDDGSTRGGDHSAPASAEAAGTGCRPPG